MKYQRLKRSWIDQIVLQEGLAKLTIHPEKNQPDEAFNRACEIMQKTWGDDWEDAKERIFQEEEL